MVQHLVKFCLFWGEKGRSLKKKSKEVKKKKIYTQMNYVWLKKAVMSSHGEIVKQPITYWLIMFIKHMKFWTN